jgi:hypothetical protein
MAVGTYEVFLEAKDIASEALGAANVAKNAAPEEAKRWLEEAERRQRERKKELLRIHISFGLALLAFLVIYLSVALCFVFKDDIDNKFPVIWGSCLAGAAVLGIAAAVVDGGRGNLKEIGPCILPFLWPIGFFMTLVVYIGTLSSFAKEQHDGAGSLSRVKDKGGERRWK